MVLLPLFLALWVVYSIGFHLGRAHAQSEACAVLKQAEALSEQAKAELRRTKNLAVSARYASGTL